MATVTDTTIESDYGPHWAWRDSDDPRDVWMVSWLPNRLLDHDQAITAIQLAATCAKHADIPTGRDGMLVQAWASELGLSGAAAVAQVHETARQATRIHQASSLPAKWEILIIIPS